MGHLTAESATRALQSRHTLGRGEKLGSAIGFAAARNSLWKGLAVSTPRLWRHARVWPALLAKDTQRAARLIVWNKLSERPFSVGSLRIRHRVRPNSPTRPRERLRSRRPDRALCPTGTQFVGNVAFLFFFFSFMISFFSHSVHKAAMRSHREHISCGWQRTEYGPANSFA